MAKQRRNKTKKKSNEFFILSLDKKKKLIGIFLIITSIMMFLSILSYSRSDQANLTYSLNDFFSVFSTNPDFLNRAYYTSNWLGIFGAYISYFLIITTIGYFSIVIPIISFVWGYTIIKKGDTNLAVNLTAFFLAAGIILATFFGVLRLDDFFTNHYELAGNIGDFLGMAIGRLFGVLGGVIITIAAFFIALFIAFDLRFRTIRNYFSKLFAKTEKDINVKYSDKSKTNLKKIKNLKNVAKKKINAKIKSEETEDLETEPKRKETNIRIVRNDEEEIALSKPQIEPEVIANTSKSKTEEDNKEIIPAIDKEVEKELPDQWDEKISFRPPGLDLLKFSDDEAVKVSEIELKTKAELLKEKLKLFDIEIVDISVTPGPVVTLYEIVPAPGVKISRIVSLEHDIALALAARGIRIIAPIPGKSAIGVEIPNEKSQLVSARSVLSYLNKSKAELPIAIGKTIIGEVYITDLAIMPHLLIAGATGSGKSVGINMLITSLIYSKHPSDVKFVIIDPKKIELSFYGRLNKHYLAVSPDLDEEIITNPQNALLVLKSVELEMEKRYDKLAKAGVRHIIDYNKKVSNPKQKPIDTDKMKHYKLPYIVVVIDELADLMMTSGKEVEAPIARLAQLARAVGIHLVVATQRPSVNVITGTIKANFPARIAYQVAVKIDSRTILDMNGADQLLGRGDMLFLPGGVPKPIRMQNAFISTDEVEAITNYIYTQQGFSKRYFLPSLFEKQSNEGANFLADMDEMFNDAARVIVNHQQGSVSLLQRRLKLGYSRAARIVDQLEEAGIVGPSEGSKAREVLVENEEQLETILRSL
ncbi:MAG: cell division protein FtsK [Ignavibacteriae bacterium]|nr:MAG: cell division protein FtsK [Ignavibacteriota bacterium]